MMPPKAKPATAPRGPTPAGKPPPAVALVVADPAPGSKGALLEVELDETLLSSNVRALLLCLNSVPCLSESSFNSFQVG